MLIYVEEAGFNPEKTLRREKSVNVPGQRGPNITKCPLRVDPEEIPDWYLQHRAPPFGFRLPLTTDPSSRKGEGGTTHEDNFDCLGQCSITSFTCSHNPPPPMPQKHFALTGAG